MLAKHCSNSHCFPFGQNDPWTVGLNIYRDDIQRKKLCFTLSQWEMHPLFLLSAINALQSVYELIKKKKILIMHHMHFFPPLREFHFISSCGQFPLLWLSQWRWAFHLECPVISAVLMTFVWRTKSLKEMIYRELCSISGAFGDPLSNSNFTSICHCFFSPYHDRLH